MLSMKMKTLLAGVSCALLALVCSGCGGGGGDDGGPMYVERTLDVSVPKFLSGNSDIYLMIPSNGMREVRIVADKNQNVSDTATSGTATGMVTFSGANMVLPYASTFTVTQTAEGTQIHISFVCYLSSQAKYVDDELCKKVMRVANPQSLTPDGMNEITVTLLFNPQTGISELVSTTRASGTGQFYNEDGVLINTSENGSPEWGIAANEWAKTCMVTHYGAIQPRDNPVVK